VATEFREVWDFVNRLSVSCAAPMIAAMPATRRTDMFTADGKPSDDDPREHVPPLFCPATDRDGDFDGAVPDPQVVAEAWEAWQEYARHMGHADLLRERIDGRLGQ
jgi:hypothetical protein